MATSEWSAAIKAEDPLGFHDRSSPEQVAAAREAGRAAFETAENPFAPQWTAENPDPKKMKELYANLGGGEDGRPMDPKKLKEFLREIRVPPRLRDSVPLVLAGDEIVWVVGGRIGEEYRVQNGSTSAVRLFASKRS